MEEAELDLKAYLDRIGWTGQVAPTLDTLAGLQLAHLSAIPFENLDVQAGLPIRLDLASLQNKLILRRRGGYCFEQNSLFAVVLEKLGFQVRLREARVRRGGTRILPRSHLALQVDVSHALFLVDVGFGADGPLEPVPLAGTETSGFGETYRVVAEELCQVLQVRRADGWLDLYALVPGSVYPADLDMANHYTSTHPDSRFVQTLTVQRSTPETRWILRNLELTTRDAHGERTETIPEKGLLPLLRQQFGLEVSADTTFRFLGP